MGKVSIGLRGWRFDEADVFTEAGTWRPLEEMPKGPRHRLLRLQVVMGKPCDACYLIHGEEEKRRCREATVVYGEPLEEILLCDRHEPDFSYWFQEEGGTRLAGEPELRDEFHEWFADGGRAPDGYGGVDHVETDPDDLPNLPDPEEIYEREQELLEDERSDFDGDGERDGAESAGTDGDDGLDGIDDLDLNREYPQ
ncbi:hypothetical protein [Halorarum halobium]|uniref:hypothetical protein n=1 Tax=Halorarum halobium TaxID=3075121 RepID=UPI0028AA970F|nr:hypothetical protein [Halobaculum sp. XH14]